MSFFDKLKQEVGKSAQEAVKNATDNQNSDGLAGASCVTVAVGNMPTTLDSFKAMEGNDFKDPNKVAALTVVALCMYPINKDLCIEMLNHLKGPRPLSSYEIQFLSDRFRDKAYLAASYFVGATPENEYEPSEPLTVNVYKTSHSEDLIGEGYLQLFLKSGGADSARGVKLRKKESTGQWFLWEYHLLPDIRKPKSADPWA